MTGRAYVGLLYIALLDIVITPDARSSDGKTGLAWVPDLQALEAWGYMEWEWRS